MRTVKRVEPKKDYFYIHATPNMSSETLGVFAGAWDVVLDDERNSNGFIWLDAHVVANIGPGFVKEEHLKIVESKTPMSVDDLAIEFTNIQARVEAVTAELVSLANQIDHLLQHL